MSPPPSRKRIRIAAGLLVAAASAGCGFRPMYASSASAPGAPEELAGVSVARIDDRAGQMLRNALLDQLTPHGAPGQPKYVLSVAMTESSDRLALRNDATATRANLRITAAYTLRQSGADATLFTSSSTFTGSYNVLLNDFATLSAENDARRRVIEELSLDIKNRLAVFLSRRGTQK